MSGPGSDRRTVLALGIALGLALLLIAFLLGRESAGTAPREAVPAEGSRPAGVDPDPDVRPTEEQSNRRWPAWADLTDDDASGVRAADSNRPVVERVEVDRTDSFANAQNLNRPQPETRPEAPGDSASNPQGMSAGAYFQEVDLIHSEQGAGDPNAFAMDLIKGGLGGATSGFDQLIDDTRLMEQQMRSLTPPASCASYHEASIDALVESREMIESMKRAIVGRDIEQLNSIALRSKALQGKAQAMKEMRKQILAQDGRN